jgi:two-component system response regulator YesN
MYKMMLVDDEPVIVESLQLLFSSCLLNCDVVATASNGREAIELYEKHEPDIIITDVKMPDMNGIEFLKTIMSKRKSDKVIVLSGFDEFSFVRDALQYKAFQYLLKPVDRTELYQVVEQAIQEMEQEKALVCSSNKQKVFDLLRRKIDITEKFDSFSYHRYLVLVVHMTGTVNVEEVFEDIQSREKLLYVYHPHKSQVVIVLGATMEIDMGVEVVIEKVLDYISEATIFVGSEVVELRDLTESYQTALKLGDIQPFVSKQVITDQDYLDVQNLKNDTAEVLRQAKEYIETQYDKGVTNESVAKHFAFSPSYFSTLFKKYHGITFIDHLTNVRIQHACTLLKDTKKTTYEIASLVGYEDQRYFSQVFKRKKAMTPSAYRKESAHK